MLPAVPPTCIMPAGTAQNPKKPDSQKPTEPTRFQAPTCQPARCGCGLHQAGCSSSMNSQALTIKKDAPTHWNSQNTPSHSLSVAALSRGATPGVPKMQGTCTRCGEREAAPNKRVTHAERGRLAGCVCSLGASTCPQCILKLICHSCLINTHPEDGSPDATNQPDTATEGMRAGHIHT